MYLKPSVLIIAYAFPPENVVGALRPFRFAKYLQRLGYDVSILTASAQNGFQHSFPICVIEPKGLTFWDKVLRKTLLPGEIGFSWVPRAVQEGKKWLIQRHDTVLFSTSPPITTHLCALWLKRAFGLRWVADFRDPLVGNPGLKIHGGLFAASVFERMIFSSADFCIANTDVVAKRWEKRYPKFSKKFSSIWNGFDPDEDIAPSAIPARTYRELLHVGEVYGGRHPGVLFSSVLRLIHQGALDPKRVKIRLIGELEQKTISDRRTFDRLLELGSLECVTEVPASKEGLRILSEADSLLLVDWTGQCAGLQVPSKLYTYVRIGRPILALTTKGSPVDMILTNSGIPYRCLYPEMSPDQVDRIVLEFFQLPTNPATPSEWFWKRFNVASQTETLSVILNSMAHFLIRF